MKTIHLRTGVVAVLLALVLPIWAQAPQLPDPGRTGMSKQQQEQAGLQAMQQVYQQMPVLPDSNPVTQYVQRLGAKLVRVIPADVSWPYQFHVVQESDINAFALPGGPIFINLGTIKAAANEAELAGVMAHEMSHVYLQHGAKQATKAQEVGILAGIVSAILGNGTAANLARLGMQVGAEGYMLKYSRGDEAQADATGAIIMYKAGYDPHAMAQFFQKLEQQGGSSAPQFLSDHPSPGNRVQAVSNEIRNWPPEQYHNDSQQFQTAKNQTNGIKAYSAQEIANGAKSGQWQRQNQQNGAVPKAGPTSSNNPPANGSAPSLSSVTYDQIKPSSDFTQMQGQGFSISYPTNWQAQPDQNGGGLIAPASAVSNGNIAYGAMIGAAQDQNAGSLQQAMQDLVQGMQQSNPGLQISAGPKSVKVAGTKGESFDLTGTSPVQVNGQPDKEHDWLVGIPYGQNAIRYIIFISPESNFSKLQPTFKKMLKSFQLQ
jgi:Zn-dependent protease with chaperone function